MLYTKVCKIFEKRKLKFKTFLPTEAVPSTEHVEILIMSTEEKKHVKERHMPQNSTTLFILGVPPESPLLEPLLLRMPLNRELLKDYYEHTVIGIDPGEHIGLAVLVDGLLFLTIEIEYNKEHLRKMILEVQKLIPSRSVEIKIGSSPPYIANNIIHYLYYEVLKELPRATLLKVDEYGTNNISLEFHPPIGKHELAAYDIALRKGHIVHNPKLKPVPEGVLKDLQHRSRNLSKSKVTISKKMAESVARGELTLEDAVKYSK